MQVTSFLDSRKMLLPSFRETKITGLLILFPTPCRVANAKTGFCLVILWNKGKVIVVGIHAVLHSGAILSRYVYGFGPCCVHVSRLWLLPLICAGREGRREMVLKKTSSLTYFQVDQCEGLLSCSDIICSCLPNCVCVCVWKSWKIETFFSW